MITSSPPRSVARGHQKLLGFHAPRLGVQVSLVDSTWSRLDRQKAKYSQVMGDGVFRFSVGIENPAGIIADLSQALDALPR